ncbi:MAG: flagellar hook-length control protein FliK [Gemmobacter sp.]
MMIAVQMVTNRRSGAEETTGPARADAVHQDVAGAWLAAIAAKGDGADAGARSISGSDIERPQAEVEAEVPVAPDTPPSVAVAIPGVKGISLIRHEAADEGGQSQAIDPAAGTAHAIRAQGTAVILSPGAQGGRDVFRPDRPASPSAAPEQGQSMLALRATSSNPPAEPGQPGAPPPAAGPVPVHAGVPQPTPQPVTPPVVSQPSAVRQVADAVVRMSSGRVELSLEPAELGRVRLTLVQEGEIMRVVVQAERPETLDLMRRSSGQLAADLRDLGFSAGGFSFADFGGAPSDGVAATEPADPPPDDAASPPAARLTALPHGRLLDLRL